MGIIFSSFNGLEPSLRFKNFTKKWNSISLKEIGTFQKGAPLSKADISQEGNPFILYGELYTTYSEVTYNVFRKTNKKVDKIYFSNVGDVILPTSGETPEEIATATCIMIPDVILAGDLYIFRQNKIDGRILSYIINHTVNGKISRIAQGKSVVHVLSEELGKIIINYPTNDEQQKIADFLSLIDQRIKKQRQLVESLKKYKRGLFSYYFQKNKSYKIARLGDFAKIYQPSTISQSQFNDGKYKVFGANGYIGNYDKYNHAVPQVTISCRGEKCGTVNFVDAYTWITGNSMVVNIDDQNEINKRYLYHCLSNQNLKYLVSGSAQPQIIRTDVARHSIPVPSIEFQEKLSFFLDSIEQKIKNEQTMEECLFDMKNALLQQMFI